MTDSNGQGKFELVLLRDILDRDSVVTNDPIIKFSQVIDKLDVQHGVALR